MGRRFRQFWQERRSIRMASLFLALELLIGGEMERPRERAEIARDHEFRRAFEDFTSELRDEVSTGLRDLHTAVAELSSQHAEGTRARPSHAAPSHSSGLAQSGVGPSAGQLLNVQIFTREARESTFGQPPGEWKAAGTAVQPGAYVQHMIRVDNLAPTVLSNVLLGLNLAANQQYVPDSTLLQNSNHPEGSRVSSDNIYTGGINVGHIAPDGVVYVMVTTRIRSTFSDAGRWKLKTVAVAGADESGPYENYTYTDVLVEQ